MPYIADLVGYRPVSEAGQAGSSTTFEGIERNRILIPRCEVANTIRGRRRKGTLSLLELLARDVTGWPARAVEFYQRLNMAQHMNHLHLDRGRTVDLRAGDALDRIAGPFDELAHNVDVRCINSHRTQGRYNIPSVVLFVWRLKEYSITKDPAYYLERRHKRRAHRRLLRRRQEPIDLVGRSRSSVAAGAYRRCGFERLGLQPSGNSSSRRSASRSYRAGQ